MMIEEFLAILKKFGERNEGSRIKEGKARQ